MTTYHRGTSLGSASDNPAYPSTSPSYSSTSPSYSHMSTSRGSGVAIMLDVGEFCTGCAQTSRRVTLDGRLHSCSRHAAQGPRHAGSTTTTSRRSLDHLADQLKKYNTRILPDPAQQPPQHAHNPTTHATLGHAPRQQQQQHQQARRGQQELYRQRSLSMKQAQYQQRVRDQRERLQSDSTLSTNQSFISGQLQSLATQNPHLDSNPAVSQHRSYNPQYEGDYELVSNVSQPLEYPASSALLSREPSLGQHPSREQSREPSREPIRVASREQNRVASREQTGSVDNPVYKGYSGVLGELNSRFKSTAAQGPESTSSSQSRHAYTGCSPSTSTITSSGLDPTSNGYPSRHASQRSLESGRVPSMDYPDNAALDHDGQAKSHSTSTADVRSRAFTTSDNRHKRFSGEFPLSSSNRAPSQPALSSPRPLDQVSHAPTSILTNASNVRHAQSISALAVGNCREPDQHRVSFSRSHAQLSYDHAPRGSSVSGNHAHSPVEPIDEQAALEAMLAELAAPTPCQRRSLTRTNSTRMKKYNAGPQRAVHAGRVPDIGRGTTLDRKNAYPPTAAPPSSKSCGTLSQQGSDRSQEIPSSRTMTSLSSRQQPEVQQQQQQQQQELASLSQSITSGCQVADIILKTFDTIPTSSLSATKQSTNDRSSLLREQYDLDHVLEKSETEVFTGDITLNRVFGLKKDGRFSTTPGTHKCNPPPTDPPRQVELAPHRNITDVTESTSNPVVNNNNNNSKPIGDCQGSNSSTLKRQPQLDVVSPSSEMNLHQLELNVAQNSGRDAGQRDDGRATLEPGETSTIRKSCTAPSSTPNGDRLPQGNSTTSASLAAATIALTSIPDPPLFPAPKSPSHDYINYKNGAYVTEQGVVAPSKSTDKPIKTDDLNSANRDYVNTASIAMEQSRADDQPLSPEMTTDLSAYEKSHSHLLTEDWNIDREIPRKKKHASSSSKFDSVSSGSTCKDQNREFADMLIAADQTPTSPDAEETTAEVSCRSSLSPERSTISSGRSIISPVRSSVTPDRSSSCSARDSSPSLEGAFESALENLSCDEDSDCSDLLPPSKSSPVDFVAESEDRGGVSMGDLLTAVNFGSSSLPPEGDSNSRCSEHDNDASLSNKNEDILEDDGVVDVDGAVLMQGVVDVDSVDGVNTVEDEEDCFFPYLTGTQPRSDAISPRTRGSLSPDTCDSGNDSAHASKPYDSNDELDIDELVNANCSSLDHAATTNPDTLQVEDDSMLTPATLTALKSSPRKKQRYKGPSERLSVEDFQHLRANDDVTSEHDTSLSTSAVSSMEGVTFIDSEDDDYQSISPPAYEHNRVLDDEKTTVRCSKGSSDEAKLESEKVTEANEDIVTLSRPQSWNTLLCEDSSSIDPVYHQQDNKETNNSAARYVYKASASKRNTDRFDMACKKAGINNAITSSELMNNDQKVISEQLDVKKVTLNFSIPAEIRLKLPEQLLRAHAQRQNTRKTVNIRKCYRIKADGTRELIEPPVVTTTGYTKNEPLPSILKSGSAYKSDREVCIPSSASNSVKGEKDKAEISDVPLDVNLQYHHVKLNKNRSTASTSLQRSIEHTDQQLQVISNRSGTKETTL